MFCYHCEVKKTKDAKTKGQVGLISFRWFYLYSKELILNKLSSHY